MKTRMMFLWMAAGMLALAACRGGEDKVSADSVYFEGAEPVDLSDVLDIYAESLKGDGDYSVSTALEGDSLGDGYGMLLFADTAFAVQLPQYAGSSQPFWPMPRRSTIPAPLLSISGATIRCGCVSWPRRRR